MKLYAIIRFLFIAQTQCLVENFQNLVGFILMATQDIVVKIKMASVLLFNPQ